MRGKVLLVITLVAVLINISWKPKTTAAKASLVTNNSKTLSFDSYASNFYNKLDNTTLNFKAFKFALAGYLKLKDEQKLTNTKYLTVIDFSKSSNKERLYIIDTETEQIIHKSVVAHGRNSGGEFATKFSNKPNSHMSSLGFYKTAETYSGKHGYSLRLDGLEFSNSNARRRAVVIHSADYASPKFAKSNGRLGRSFGCPSLPKQGYEQVIAKIKEGSCLFIYHPQKTYISNSKLANAAIPGQV